MKQILEQLNLDANATEEQAVYEIKKLQAKPKVSKWNHPLTEEQEADVQRRRNAGLSLEDAIAATMAQTKHDEALAEKSEKGKKGGKGAAALLLGFLLAAGALMPSRASAQMANVISVPTYTNVVSGFSTNTSANTPTNPSGFQINPGQNVTILVSMLSTNAGTPNELFGFQGSHDFTNWTSSAALTGTVALQGSNVTTTAAFTFTNVSFNYLRWYSWGNAQTAAVSLAGAPMQAILK